MKSFLTLAQTCEIFQTTPNRLALKLNLFCLLLIRFLLMTIPAQLRFIRAYRERMGLSGSSDSLHSEEHIQLEASTYALASHLLVCVWSIYQGKHATIPFGYWVNAARLTQMEYSSVHDS